jgi:hypothetical protein
MLKAYYYKKQIHPNTCILYSKYMYMPPKIPTPFLESFPESSTRIHRNPVVPDQRYTHGRDTITDEIPTTRSLDDQGPTFIQASGGSLNGPRTFHRSFPTNVSAPLHVNRHLDPQAPTNEYL